MEKLAFLARRMQQVAQEEEQLRSALAVFDAVVATGETSGGETKAPIGIPSIESTTIAMDSAFFYE